MSKRGKHVTAAGLKLQRITARESGEVSPGLHGAKFKSAGRLGMPLDMRGGEALKSGKPDVLKSGDTEKY